jgi:nitrile hydratase accessory protein
MTGALKPEELDQTPLLPRDNNGPVFQEPWQAQAFSIVLELANHGVMDWNDWCKLLSTEIRLAQADGDPDLGDTYYLHWLSALEKLVTANTDITQKQLADTKADWQSADDHREFGEAPLYVKGASHAKAPKTVLTS